MMDLTPAKRVAGCITLLALMTACGKKEEPAEHASPAAVETVDIASLQAPAAPPPAEKASARAAAAPAAAPNLSERRSAASEETPAQPKPLTMASAAQQLGGGTTAYNDGERKFIRTASANFRVKDVYLAALGIEDSVASHGGFVVKNEISTGSTRTERQAIGDGKLIELNEYTVEGQLVVRVPSAKTQEFLRAIAGHVVFLDERKYAAHDAQFDLLRQQLDAMRSQETQAELGEAVRDGGRLMQRTEVIAMRGDAKSTRDAALLAKKVFEDQVAFSTIALTLRQPSRVLQSERVDVDSMYRQLRPGFASRLQDQLRGGWDGTLNVFLALAGLWPLLLVALLGGVPIWRALRSRNKAGTPG
ncbi:DUF4349 domain-containing protein [Massilia rubra]|uniref:DUF4349 domain-containing protein n=1 Tax=Massilia rubra TaxID=2607910 RepID=A0ABX0LHE0_9BURK|nr:DUF4349 domain-containing protein [Massilia rubra]NHZ34243.1 DUF4349 domain-containing protein [Massilia rubra]